MRKPFWDVAKEFSYQLLIEFSLKWYGGLIPFIYIISRSCVKLLENGRSSLSVSKQVPEESPFVHQRYEAYKTQLKWIPNKLKFSFQRIISFLSLGSRGLGSEFRIYDSWSTCHDCSVAYGNASLRGSSPIVLYWAAVHRIGSSLWWN